MASYIIRRLIGAVVVLFGISIITFIIAYAAPGDPARLIVGAKAPQSVVDAVRHNLGLDQPLPVQYIHYVGRLLQEIWAFRTTTTYPSPSCWGSAWAIPCNWPLAAGLLS